MKRILPLILIICVLSFNITGCVKRVSITSIERERVDQNISSGNSGFISGSIPPEDEPKKRVLTRKVYQVTMEVPPYPEWKHFRASEFTPDNDIWGNRGYIYGGPNSVMPKDDEEAAAQGEDIVLPDENSYTETKENDEEVFFSEQIKEEVSFSLYKVRKGDTLQKVSKNVYGTTKKWKKIYDFNKDTLKNPNKIYPGQKIKIPQ